MRTGLEAADDPHLHPLQRREARLRQPHHVCRVGEIADAQAQGSHDMMVLVEQPDLPAGPTDCLAGRDLVGVERGAVEAAGGLSEGIAEALAQLLERGFGSVTRECALPHAVDRSQIVQAHDVVGVRVGPEHGVEPPASRGEELRAHGRAAVHQQRRALGRVAEQGRGAGAAVARLGRVAGAPIPRLPRAPERGNALGGAGAKEDDAEGAGHGVRLPVAA